jgi:2'-5' RNA ligase
MRLFVALDVDTSSFRDELAAIREAVKCRAKFVSFEIMHITLKFLGEVSKEKLQGVQAKLDTLGSFGPFDVTLSGLGAFPSMDRPRVLWIGALSDRLPVLAETIESLLGGFGQPSRGFHSHLTLARIKERCDLHGLVEKYKGKKFSEFTADSVVLKESILMPKGPTYRTLHEVKL